MAATDRGKLRRRLRVTIPLVAAAMIVIGFLSSVNWTGRHPAYLQVDLKALGYFPFDQVAGSIKDVPAAFRAFDGKKVSLEGFIWDLQSGRQSATEFQLIYQVSGDMHRPPQVQERVFATTTHPVPDLDYAEVYGTLHVNPKRGAGGVVSLYQLDVDGVRDPEKATPVPITDQVLDKLIPIGAIILVIAGLREFLLLIRRYPSKGMKQPNVCAVCGYDLRATPHRCPECGTKTEVSRRFDGARGIEDATRS